MEDFTIVAFATYDEIKNIKFDQFNDFNNLEELTSEEKKDGFSVFVNVENNEKFVSLSLGNFTDDMISNFEDGVKTIEFKEIKDSLEIKDKEVGFEF